MQTLAADIDALVKLLRHANGALGGHVEFVVRLLLHGAGGERRGGFGGGNALLDLINAVRGAAHTLGDRLGVRGIRDLDLVAAEIVEGRPYEIGFHPAVAGLVQIGEDGPVLLGHEGADLVLAVDDHFESGGLHSSRAHARFAARGRQLAREDGGYLVAHQPVQHSPRLLGIHEVHVDGAGALHGGAHRLRGYLVELDAHLVALYAEDVFEVPAYGFAFAVGVGREIDALVLANRLRELVYGLLFFGRDDILRLEPVLDIYAETAGGKIADMSL